MTFLTNGEVGLWHSFIGAPEFNYLEEQKKKGPDKHPAPYFF